MTRLEIHNMLKTYCNNCYYVPPSKLEYPCLIYDDTKRRKRNANDKAYIVNVGYEITYISKDPLDPIPNKLLDEVIGMSFSRKLVINNLTHWYLELY